MMHCLTARTTWQARSLVVVLLMCVLSISSYSQGSELLAPDVRVIIDVSGSMKQNDPHNLRRPALDLLVQLLPKDAKAGVWTFGEQVNMLVFHRVIDAAWRKDASGKAKDINSVALYTNIGGALEKAAYDFDRLKGKYRSSVILLTDGVVDISKQPEKNQQERGRIITKVLPRYVQAGVNIHTIALSPQADRALLERLAIDTGGMAATAESADELMKIFLRAFDDAAPEEQVPLKGNKFLIDSSIEEFTTLVFRKASIQQARVQPTILLAPDGARYVGSKDERYVRWHHTQDYDLMTVERPLEGEWEIIANADPDNRVTVVSNLSLFVKDVPRNVFLGQLPDVEISLRESGRAITHDEFLKLLDVSVEVYSVDNKKRWKKTLSSNAYIPADGIYSASLSMLKIPGQYEITVDVDGKTFQRSNKQRVSVREAFKVKIVDDQRSSVPAKLISLLASNNLIDMDKSAVFAQIKKPSGRSLIKSLPKLDDRQWQLSFSALDESGDYLVSMKVEGVYRDGSQFISNLDTVSFSFDAGVPPPVVEKPIEKPVEEDVVVEPPLESVEEALPEVETEKSDDGNNILLYSGLVIGNLLILGLGFLAYRLVTSGSKSEILENDSVDNADIESDQSSQDGDTAMPVSDSGGESGDDSFAGAEANNDLLGDLDDLLGDSNASENGSEAEQTGENAASESSDEDDSDPFDFADDIIEIAPDEDEDS